MAIFNTSKRSHASLHPGKAGSCKQPLIQMRDKRYENLDNGKLTGFVFLGIRKAFDPADHNILLNEMKTQFGFINIELDWF